MPRLRRHRRARRCRRRVSSTLGEHVADRPLCFGVDDDLAEASTPGRPGRAPRAGPRTPAWCSRLLDDLDEVVEIGRRADRTRWSSSSSRAPVARLSSRLAVPSSSPRRRPPASSRRASRRDRVGRRSRHRGVAGALDRLVDVDAVPGERARLGREAERDRVGDLPGLDEPAERPRRCTASSSQFSGAPSCSIWVRRSDSVSIQPGLTWLTRMPWRISPNARFLVMTASAALDIA